MLYLTQKNAAQQSNTAANQFIYEGEFSVTSGTTDNILIPLGVLLASFEIYITSGTASMEYSLDTIANIEADTATWDTFEDEVGTTSFGVGDKVHYPMNGVKAVRLIATGGTSRIVVNAFPGGN